MIGSLVVGDVDEADLEEVEEFHEEPAEDDDEDDEDGETEEEFVDLTGEDRVEIETRHGDEDDGEPNFVFDPAFVRLDEGTTVEWVNTDGVFHTVTSSDSIDQRSGGGDEFDGTISSDGDTFVWEASKTGTQPYYCAPHAGFMYGALEIE